MAGHGNFVVVANRLPVSAEVADDGTTTWSRSPGGLVSALEPMLRGGDAAWVGWSGRLAPDPEAGDDLPPLEPVPDDVGPCPLDEVELTRRQVEGYYEGFSNSTLWPLFHDAIVPPVYHRHQWDPYVEVNRLFAGHVAAVAAEGATVWVHDYQLMLVPAMLRELRPDLRIGFFLHIPFPPLELFVQLPWRRAIAAGLLGADLVGFHTPGGAANFLAVVARLLDVEPDPGGVVVADPHAHGGHRRVTVQAFPISIDTKGYDAIARTPEVRAKAEEIREKLGNPKRVLLGVDRLDYTKGIDVRLKAVSELLADGSIEPGEAVFVQIATPSRENVEDYQRLRDDIELMIGRAMGDFRDIGSPPIQYLHQPLDRESLVAFYVAADVMLVTPYRDGMNLVAKEYVAARPDDDGALVLSEFTGAAVELTQAFLVNPYDADGVKQAIRDALAADPADLRQRMHAMREHLFEHDVDRWAGDFLTALEKSQDHV
ncbi:MAG: trehalose-6-phosphate synthase [Frankiales bacterium]|nr:trehalose-6-phosphate synthase [Frankiales bacterium]